MARASYYRFLQKKEPQQSDCELRDRIQKICLEHRFYGYRRVRQELLAQGLVVNHKKVRRIMRDDNLLAMRKRKWVSPQSSDRPCGVFPNLAPHMDVTGVNQLWVADITYIRLEHEFVYLAVVIDAYSRRVVGWSLDRSLTASLPRRALLRAIEERKPPAGLIHHSDRGSQYASREYVDVLNRYGMLGSMSQPAYPWDNAICESFMATLKREQIDCNEYRSLEQLRRHVQRFIEDYYNVRRLHSALDYRSPAAFESTGSQARRSA